MTNSGIQEISMQNIIITTAMFYMPQLFKNQIECVTDPKHFYLLKLHV